MTSAEARGRGGSHCLQSSGLDGIEATSVGQRDAGINMPRAYSCSSYTLHARLVRLAPSIEVSLLLPTLRKKYVKSARGTSYSRNGSVESAKVCSSFNYIEYLTADG